ncbi:uncharacterized protein EURHEDRAFT_547143 [Aspergillus ruber CBS 135680]|uniref:Aminoglycoside phosphotransferase domain-containing protein n=1 Tax=Aspergillus ruber (strain CBS 135680) TaxID=1388766 RepID=A0A017S3J2_ASPRC|nr:uncharacterized protein EURHEDRAFT_547143 [Aspergillus ruber CBS 135680]EYE91199.1 hypothetical protein EURHEDRAFT_547143 [Aspergillus ruber CBS 135680]
MTQCKSGQQVVAKLYIFIYMDDDGFYTNPFLVADKEYTNETAAYQALSGLQGSKIPLYYRTYSLDIPVPGPKEDKRSVRLILIDFIPEPFMLEAEPCGFSQEARQKIMKSNMSFCDLHPRNIMLTDRGTVFIDLGDIDQVIPGMYISPLLWWREAQDRTYRFENWIEWDWQRWLEAKFGYTAATIKPETHERFLLSSLAKCSNSLPSLF